MRIIDGRTKSQQADWDAMERLEHCVQLVDNDQIYARGKLIHAIRYLANRRLQAVYIRTEAANVPTD